MIYFNYYRVEKKSVIEKSENICREIEGYARKLI